MGRVIGDEFETYQNLKVIPEVLAFITATFDDVGEHTHETEVHVGDGVHDDGSGASPAASIFPSLSSLFSSSSSSSKKDEADEDSSDDLSVESDESFDSYDSELEDLDDAFEEEEDEVYEHFDKSFLDPAFCGERARLTIMFQVVQKWGLPLLDKSPPLDSSAKLAPADEGIKRKKKKRRRGEIVISQREIASLLR